MAVGDRPEHLVRRVEDAVDRGGAFAGAVRSFGLRQIVGLHRMIWSMRSIGPDQRVCNGTLVRARRGLDRSIRRTNVTTPDRSAGYHRSGDPADRRQPGGRAPVPGDPPPPRAAALATGRAGERDGGRRPARFAPVRSARGRRPEPRPRAARPDRRLPARAGPTACSTRSGASTRPTTRASRSSRRPSCPGTG